MTYTKINFTKPWVGIAIFSVLCVGLVFPRVAQAAVTITDVAVTNITSTAVTISWKSNVHGDSWVGYVQAGTSDQFSVANTLPEQAHTMQLKDLLPDTTYIYEVNTQTSSGETGYIAGLTFKTAADGGSGGGAEQPCGTLAKQGAAIYILTGKDKVKIPFTSMAAFTGLGYNLKNVKTLDVSSYRSSGSYFLSSATQEHPWCSWMKWKDGTVYYSHPSGSIPVPSWEVFVNNGGRADLIVPMNAADDAIWAQNPNLAPLQMNDSRVL